MLRPSDLIYLPYSPDFTQSGIRYALRSLPYTYDRMGGAKIQRLRRIVSGIAVEHAFRRYLNGRGLAFDRLGNTPYTDPDHYDIAVNGRRCDLKSFQFFSRRQISALQERPDYLLKAAALVPADQAAAPAGREKDLYVFAFMTARLADDQENVQQALSAGLPIDLIHPLPVHWARPVGSGSIGRPVFKFEGPGSLDLEVGGQISGRDFKTLRLRLPAGRRTPTQKEFHSLHYLRTSVLPRGRAGVYSPVLKETHVAAPEEWQNIWVYGLQVILAGWLAREEFLQRARRLPAGSRVLQYARTRTENLAVSVAELRPIKSLLGSY